MRTLATKITTNNGNAATMRPRRMPASGRLQNRNHAGGKAYCKYRSRSPSIRNRPNDVRNHTPPPREHKRQRARGKNRSENLVGTCDGGSDRKGKEQRLECEL